MCTCQALSMRRRATLLADVTCNHAMSWRYATSYRLDVALSTRGANDVSLRKKCASMAANDLCRM